jgi:hypothetical protein
MLGRRFKSLKSTRCDFSLNGDSFMAKNPIPAPTDDFQDQNEAAVREAREADRIEPRAGSVRYDAERGLVLVELRTGFAFGFPPERIAGLESATAADLGDVRTSPSGDGLHWDDLNVDASLTGLIIEALNLREWSPRLMGQARSEAKARAARLNGLKGGRPRRSGSSTRKTKKSS